MNELPASVHVFVGPTPDSQPRMKRRRWSDWYDPRLCKVNPLDSTGGVSNYWRLEFLSSSMNSKDLVLDTVWMLIFGGA